MYIKFQLFLLCAISISCKSYDYTLTSVEKAHLYPKILPLEKRIEPINDVERYFFIKEIEENVIDPFGDIYSDLYGSIEIESFVFKSKVNTFPWLVINFPLLYIPMLFGMPDSYPVYVIEVELRIIDSQNQLIEKYTEMGRGRNVAAMYYGYSFSNAVTKSYADALNNALNQIRPKLQADAERINNELIKAGKL